MIPYPLEDGYLRLSDDLFDRDALVLENRQTQRVSLCRPDKKPYVEVTSTLRCSASGPFPKRTLLSSASNPGTDDATI